MREKGFCVIDYIDDYVKIGIQSVVFDSFNYLTSLMNDLGLTISEKKLVASSTKVICLGVLIDTKKGSISIPEEKLLQIQEMVTQWLNKRTCTKRQVQSILGLLLYFISVCDLHAFFSTACWNSSGQVTSRRE